MCPYRSKSQNFIVWSFISKGVQFLGCVLSGTSATERTHIAFMSILLQNHLGRAAPCSRRSVKSIVTMESVVCSLASHLDLSRWHQLVPLWFLPLSMANAFFTGIITATATCPFLHSWKKSEMCLSKHYCLSPVYEWNICCGLVHLYGTLVYGYSNMYINWIYKAQK